MFYIKVKVIQKQTKGLKLDRWSSYLYKTLFSYYRCEVTRKRERPSDSVMKLIQKTRLYSYYRYEIARKELTDGVGNRSHWQVNTSPFSNYCVMNILVDVNTPPTILNLFSNVSTCLYEMFTWDLVSLKTIIAMSMNLALRIRYTCV